MTNDRAPRPTPAVPRPVPACRCVRPGADACPCARACMGARACAVAWAPGSRKSRDGGAGRREGRRSASRADRRRACRPGGGSEWAGDAPCGQGRTRRSDDGPGGGRRNPDDRRGRAPRDDDASGAARDDASSPARRRMRAICIAPRRSSAHRRPEPFCIRRPPRVEEREAPDERPAPFTFAGPQRTGHDEPRRRPENFSGRALTAETLDRLGSRGWCGAPAIQTSGGPPRHTSGGSGPGAIVTRRDIAPAPRARTRRVRVCARARARACPRAWTCT